MESLQGTRGVITGGGDGIGRAIALHLARAGMHITIADIRADAGEEAVGAIRAAGGNAHFHHCDVTLEDSVRELARDCFAAGDVDMIWANAGLGTAQGFTRGKAKNLNWMYAVNVHGVIHTLSAFLPTMLEQTGRRYVGITASVASLVPGNPANPAYGASKYATLGIAEGLRAELKDVENISVTALCPGLVNTGIWNSARARPDHFGGPRNLAPEAGAYWTKNGMPADVVGFHAVEALRAGRFYVVTPHNEEVLPVMEKHHQEIMDGVIPPADWQSSLEETE